METQTQTYLFKSPQRSWKYFMPDGKALIFANYEYSTADEGEVAELTYQIKRGHPAIYVDPNEPYVTAEKLDPLAGLRKRIQEEERAKILAEMAAATNPERDMGVSVQERLRPSNTTDIAAVTVGDASSRLAALRSSTASKE